MWGTLVLWTRNGREKIVCWSTIIAHTAMIVLTNACVQSASPGASSRGVGVLSPTYDALRSDLVKPLRGCALHQTR